MLFILYNIKIYNSNFKIAIIVTVLVTKSSENIIGDETLPNIKSTKRLDCLPKSRLYNSSQDEKLCLDRKCIYDLDTSKLYNSPACYYNTNNLRFRLSKTEETNLGKKYTIKSITFNYDVIVEFEFLTQEVFRFKLSKVLNSGKNYEVPIQIRKTENRAEDTYYDLQVSSDNDDFYFKIIRKKTKQVM